MTKQASTGRCGWCGRPLGDRAATGRPAAYCRDRACRQRAYEARRTASAHGLAAGDVVVRSEAVRALADDLWALTAALDDVDADAADGVPVAERYRHLYDAVARFRGRGVDDLLSR